MDKINATIVYMHPGQGMPVCELKYVHESPTDLAALINRLETNKAVQDWFLNPDCLVQDIAGVKTAEFITTNTARKLANKCNAYDNIRVADSVKDVCKLYDTNLHPLNAIIKWNGAAKVYMYHSLRGWYTFDVSDAKSKRILLNTLLDGWSHIEEYMACKDRYDKMQCIVESTATALAVVYKAAAECPMSRDVVNTMSYAMCKQHPLSCTFNEMQLQTISKTAIEIGWDDAPIHTVMPSYEYTHYFRVYGIDWDVTEEDADETTSVEKIKKSLPTEIDRLSCTLPIFDTPDTCDLEYEICGRLSEAHGFCVNSFFYEPAKLC